MKNSCANLRKTRIAMTERPTTEAERTLIGAREIVSGSTEGGTSAMLPSLRHGAGRGPLGESPGGLPQPGGEIRRDHRRAEVEPLRRVAAETQQAVQRLFVLHALGDHLEPHEMTQIDDGVDDTVIAVGEVRGDE